MLPAKQIKRHLSPSVSPSKSESDVGKCPICSEPVISDDALQCVWCEASHHRCCLKISVEQCNMLANIVSNIVFMCKSCLQMLPVAFQYYESHQNCEPKLASIESKLSDLQSTESQLSTTVKKIESQLSEYHKSVLSKPSNDSDPPPSTPISDTSINQLSKRLEVCSTDYHSLLTKQWQRLHLTCPPKIQILFPLL